MQWMHLMLEGTSVLQGKDGSIVRSKPVSIECSMPISAECACNRDRPFGLPETKLKVLHLPRDRSTERAAGGATTRLGVAVGNLHYT
eukprot:354346-Chlamydomonas_euryale.AAC.4